MFYPETSQREELHLEVSDDVSLRLNDEDLVSIALTTKDRFMIFRYVTRLLRLYHTVCTRVFSTISLVSFAMI